MTKKNSKLRILLLGTVFGSATNGAVADVTVLNGQTVTTTQTVTGAEQVSIDAGGTIDVTNASAIAINNGTAITITNNGTISNTSATGFNQLINFAGASGPVTINNTGVMTTNAFAGIFMFGSASPITITNSGTITATGSLGGSPPDLPFAILTGSGNDIVNLTTSSVINGRIVVAASPAATQAENNVLNLSGTGQGTMRGFSSNLPGNVFVGWDGFKTLNINSGDWTLLGQGAYNSATIAAGASLVMAPTSQSGVNRQGFVYLSDTIGIDLTVNGALTIPIGISTTPGIYWAGFQHLRLHGASSGVINLETGGSYWSVGNDYLGLTNLGAGAELLITGDTQQNFNVLNNGVLIVGGAVAATTNDPATNAPRVQLVGPGPTGSISGNLNVAAGGRVIFNRSNDYDYGGALSGQGSLVKRGAGTLTLSGLYTFTGTTTIESGNVIVTSQLPAQTVVQVGSGSNLALAGDQTVAGLNGAAGSTVNVQGGSLTVDGSGPTTFGGAITGNGGLNVEGGSLTLTGGSTYGGDTNVTGAGSTLSIAPGGSITSDTTVGGGGTLVVNGAAGDVNVAPGGTVGGAGQINGELNVGQGGAVAPGNSPGTLVIAGNFVEAGVYIAETQGGVSDRIEVSGAATIANTATVQATPLDATAANPRRATYTILNAAGGVTGQFASVSSTNAAIAPFLSYSNNSVFLTLVNTTLSLASIGQTPNQIAAGGAVSGLGLGAALFNAVTPLSDPAARSALDGLSGDFHAGLANISVEDARLVREAALARLDGRIDAGGQFWAQALTNNLGVEGAGRAASIRRSQDGLLIGYDRGDAVSRFGALLSYTSGEARAHARNASADAETISLGAYGASNAGVARLRYGGSIGWQDIETQRATAFAAINDRTRGETDGRLAQAFIEAGWRTDAMIEPVAGLAWVGSDLEGFAEQGGATALNVGDGERNVGFATLGARIGGDGDSAISPRLFIAYRRAFGDIDATTPMRFRSGGPAFNVEGAQIDEDAVTFDAALGWRMLGGRAALAYAGTYGERASDTAIKLDFAVALN